MNAQELVQYYVVNSELGMSVGKIAGQVAHASNIIGFQATGLEFPEDPDHNFYKFCKYNDWSNNPERKIIILRGKTKDLEKLESQGFYAQRDLGLTEIPKGSLTCVGLGIMTREEAKPYIKRLQLL